MKTCSVPDCPGVMQRRAKALIKSTGETKIRLRCACCGTWESHYIPPASGGAAAVKIEKRPGGRPGIRDVHTFSTGSAHVSVIA